MQRKKRIQLIVLLAAICTAILVIGASFCTASTIQNFSDVGEEDWFFEDVEYVCKKELMNGTSDDAFAPYDSTTRAMIVTILWRLDGESVSEGKSFGDVAKTAYYYDAVAWASGNGIVSGYDEKRFGPEDCITREQLAAILYRYISCKKTDAAVDADISKFKDCEEISEYAVDAMKWAIANNIITGVTDDTISPKGYATRGQVAAILKRVCTNILDTDENKKEEVSVENNKVSGGSSGGSSGGRKPSADSKDENDDVPKEEVGTEDTKDEASKDKLIVNVNPASAKAGDDVSVVVDLQKNPGILGAVMSLIYDETAMTLVSVDNGEAVSDVLTLTRSKELKSGVKFVWDGIEIDDDSIQDGALMVLNFRLSSEATSGKKYPLELLCKSGDIIDANLKKVEFDISQGYVEVE